MNPTCASFRKVRMVFSLVTSLCLAASVRAATEGYSPQLSTTNHQLIAEQFAKSPAVFIQNKGQWANESIRFALSSRGANVGVTDEGLRFQMFQRGPLTNANERGSSRREEAHSQIRNPKSEIRNYQSLVTSAATRMKEFSVRFVGAKRVTPVGEGKAQQVFHYHRGGPEWWGKNVPSHEAVMYRRVYDGIDLRGTGGRTGIKYEFIVAPGADWRQVRVRYDGIERLTLREAPPPRAPQAYASLTTSTRRASFGHIASGSNLVGVSPRNEV